MRLSCRRLTFDVRKGDVGGVVVWPGDDSVLAKAIALKLAQKKREAEEKAEKEALLGRWVETVAKCPPSKTARLDPLPRIVFCATFVRPLANHAVIVSVTGVCTCCPSSPLAWKNMTRLPFCDVARCQHGRGFTRRDFPEP
jgi:hypothetical protein